MVSVRYLKRDTDAELPARYRKALNVWERKHRMKITLPCSLRRAGAIQVASEPTPRLRWWLRVVLQNTSK